MAKESKSFLQPSDDKIDVNDIPELGEEYFDSGQQLYAERHVIAIGIDADVLAWFKDRGPDYQAQINNLLRKYMEAHNG
ncbi:MAG: BrnA antitoxin family protein [Cellvibrionaceae bacterium]|nr:BrnA antitoxin family protein [Cellvibrionaceae bacterium]MCV6625750.1 BrnA antitoxin family protein [Cellvibrionaceae bacterium]